jgi:hypothetical protein
MAIGQRTTGSSIVRRPEIASAGMVDAIAPRRAGEGSGVAEMKILEAYSISLMLARGISVRMGHACYDREQTDMRKNENDA